MRRGTTSSCPSQAQQQQTPVFGHMTSSLWGCCIGPLAARLPQCQLIIDGADVCRELPGWRSSVRLNALRAHQQCGQAWVVWELRVHEPRDASTSHHSPHSQHLFCAVDQVKFGPPLRKVTEPYPDLVRLFSTTVYLWQFCVLMTSMNMTICPPPPFSRAPMMTTGVCLERKTTHRKPALCFYTFMLY